MLDDPVARFVLRVLAWLPPLFIVWYLTAPFTLAPAGLLAGAVARIWLAGIVSAVDQHGAVVTFTTTLRPGSAITEAGVLTVDVDLLLYSFGLPLFAALVLAARQPHWPRLLWWGSAALLPLVALGVVADFLKNIAITAGPMVASQSGFSGWQRELIAFAFQFGSLVLPSVTPVVAWVATHRGYCARLRPAA
jgi:hypothetical protein